MKKTEKILTMLVLLGMLTISACAKNSEKTPEIVENPPANLATTSWITESVQSTQSGVTIELLHVTQRGEDLVLRVKFGLPDWRNWYISKVKLTLVGEGEYGDAKTVFFERLYQKTPNTYCLYQPSYNEEEKCLTNNEMKTYQIDELIFGGLPDGFKDKEMVLEVLELSTAPGEETYCEDVRLPYIEEVLSGDYPGLKLECQTGENSTGYRISEESGYADDPEAKQAVEAMIEEAASGKLTGLWTLEVSR